MKRLPVFLAFFISVSALAQGKNKAEKLLIGYNFSPDYSFRTLKNKDGSTSGDLIIHIRNGMEIAKISYTTGINICLQFSTHVGFETGIQFLNKGYKTKSQDFVYSTPGTGLPVKVNTTYAYHYIGIPLKVKFLFGKSKCQFHLSVGFMTNLLLQDKQTNNYTYANGKTEKKKETTSSLFKKADISPMLSTGLNYRFNRKIHFFAEPVFRYGAITTTDTPVTENLWNAGLNIGIYYVLQ